MAKVTTETAQSVKEDEPAPQDDVQDEATQEEAAVQSLAAEVPAEETNIDILACCKY